MSLILFNIRNIKNISNNTSGILF